MVANSHVLQIPSVAYLSMEIGLRTDIPTYSGGLGMLAGDTLRAAADFGIPIVGVTLLYRKGYFQQRLDETGNQTSSPTEWVPEDLLVEMPPRVTVEISGRDVAIRAWRYLVEGRRGYQVPVYLLDTDLPENDPESRRLTDHLYGGDNLYRLSQEVILGIGSVAILQALGHENIAIYHLNEGHAALLSVALIERQRESAGSSITPQEIESIRMRNVFTTHTPVPAGHDHFPLELGRQVLGDARMAILEECGCIQDNALNMTTIGLTFSRYINGVAMRHGEVAQTMFPNYPINSITNGVHAATWAADSFQRLYDRHFPEWRQDSLYLRYALNLPLDEVADAHREAKRCLLNEVEARRGVRFEESVLTIGFARRATPYKRADLLFSDIQRLRRIAAQAGPLQIVYAGKAHPRDEEGVAIIRRVYEAAESLGESVKVVWLENYDMQLGRLLCGGVDIWLNTPMKPLEASGTSGMKAAINAVPSLSVIDGWWVEGHVEGVTGWAIGDESVESDHDLEIESLYDQLRHKIVPLYYGQPEEFTKVGRSAIALNGSFFSAQRMLSQYVTNAYQSVAADVRRSRQA